MKKKTTINSDKKKGDISNADIKNNASEEQEIKKGYNEKNPAQPQGAFKPDSVSKKS